MGWGGVGWGGTAYTVRDHQPVTGSWAHRGRDAGAGRQVRAAKRRLVADILELCHRALLQRLGNRRGVGRTRSGHTEGIASSRRTSCTAASEVL